MGRRPAPQTLALRDQVLAALRALDGLPVPTKEVPTLLGLRQVFFGYGPDSRPWCDACRYQHADPVQRYPEHQKVYVALKALAAAGDIVRVAIDDHQSLYWQAWAQDAVDLDALLEAEW